MHSHHDHTEGAATASSSPSEQDAVTAARMLIADEEQARMRACAAELEQVLARYGMRLDVAPPQISIVPAS